MKRKYIFAATFALCITAIFNFAHAQDQPKPSFDECLDSAKRMTLYVDASIECLTSEQNRVTEELDSLYSSSLASLPEKKRSLLIASQDAWKKSLEADTLFNLELQAQDDGSVSTFGPIYGRIALISTRIRMLSLLMSLYHGHHK